MTQTLFAQKNGMTESYLGDKRVAVTKLTLYDSAVIGEKTADKDGYVASVVSFGKTKKNAHKAAIGAHKGAAVKTFVREVTPFEAAPLVAGTMVHVQATSKGKGTAGVMKRWNFAGGPRTHGQSDRARAPGSIGQGTTPGRVLKGRHMAGRMGNEIVTVKNLMIVAVDEATKSLWVAGPVPGHTSGLVTITVTDKIAKIEDLKYLKGFNTTPVVAAEAVTEVVEEATL